METEKIPIVTSNGEKTVAIAEIIVEHAKNFNARDRLKIDLEKGYITKLFNEILSDIKEENDSEFFAVLLMLYGQVHFESFVQSLPNDITRTIYLMFALKTIQFERK